MNDRELLEKAAKAAGIHGIYETGVIWYKNPFGDEVGFNPLKDDGDALRLAVKLRISLIHEQEYMGGPVIETIEATGPRREDFSRHCEMRSLNCEGDDEMASTRRAIVMAAAAMAND